MEPRWVIGLMTGTVVDNLVDVAAIRTDGEAFVELGPWRLVPYDPAIGALVTAAMEAALAWRFAGPPPAIFAEAEHALTLAQSDAVETFLAETGLPRNEIAAVGFHGQTVLHRAPEPGRAGDTLQLGDGALMAERLGLPVVFDFRTEDMRVGGHGAPVSPTWHAALLRLIGAGPETAILNLGGVANLTALAPDGTIHGFDTGPANGPIDDWIARHGRGAMDVHGAIAGSGRVDEARLARLLEHPFLSAPYPKSLDRYDFSADMANGLTLADGAATLTAFTAASVGRALALLPVRPRRIVVAGGGRKNPVLMRALAERADVEALAAEAVGLRGDAVEAECFAWLAMRRLRNLPISFPLTTGVPEPMTGGRIARPNA